MMIDLYRENRDMPSLRVKCADQCCHNELDTPLVGVTVVTLVDMVPMPPLKSGTGTNDGTVSFAP